MLTVDALNEKIKQDAEISDDGTIADYIPPAPPAPEETESQPVVANVPVDSVSTENPPTEVLEPVTTETPQSSSSTLFVVVPVAIVGGILIAVMVMKKTREKKKRGDI